MKDTDGICYIENNNFFQNNKQKIIKDLNQLSPYDYDFDDQVLDRPYNGKVVKGIDYEMSEAVFILAIIVRDNYSKVLWF